MKKRNQLLTLIMAGVMALSPAAAFAEETEAETQEAAVETEAAETEADGAEAADGDVFPFTLVTKDDQEVTFTHVPERVISTNPNTGEQLLSLIHISEPTRRS